MTSRRDQILLCDDDALLAQCRCDRMRGTGRGGQKRNVTDSAVRLTHLESGATAYSDASRSQAHNRRDALRALRLNLAFAVRNPPPPEWTFCQPPGRKDPRYAIWLAQLLDVLQTVEYRISDAARRTGTSTGRLVRDLAGDTQLWQHVNEERRRRGMGVLRA